MLAVTKKSNTPCPPPDPALAAQRAERRKDTRPASPFLLSSFIAHQLQPELAAIGATSDYEQAELFPGPTPSGNAAKETQSKRRQMKDAGRYKD